MRAAMGGVGSASVLPWAQEATAYNGLVTAWPELTRLASQAPPAGSGQRDLFGGKP